MQKNIHTTVLLHEALDILDLKKGDIVVDGTLGAGGHTIEILNRMKGDIYILGIDLDQKALNRSQERIDANPYVKNNVILVRGNFADLKKSLSLTQWKQVDKIILDLGFSSNQLELDERGLSFQRDEPLLMTLSGEKEDTTAYDVVNHWSEETLADIIYGFGEEQFSRRIAKAIVESRKTKAIQTTFELSDIIKSSVPLFYQKGKIHPATKTFQAIRIAVNRELENLKQFLDSIPYILSKGGRVSIISFHSLEDRIIKRYFQDFEKDGIGTRITKKPIIPSEEELKANPRSRSAKLRGFQVNI